MILCMPCMALCEADGNLIMSPLNLFWSTDMGNHCLMERLAYWMVNIFASACRQVGYVFTAMTCY